MVRFMTVAAAAGGFWLGTEQPRTRTIMAVPKSRVEGAEAECVGDWR